jgi:hypothetical protein
MSARTTCAWCFESLGDVVDEFNSGYGHEECVRWVAELLAGPDSMPMPSPRRFYRDRRDAVAFLERLGHEAARLGLDSQVLAEAVSRALR